MTVTTPLPGRWTIEDVLALPDDGNRHELADGNLIVSPPPAYAHTITQVRLTRLLMAAAPPELFVNGAGPGVRIGDSFFVPDLVVVRADAEQRTDILLDPADVVLVVEVLSPGTRGRDLVLKRSRYAANGIPHYWILDREVRRLTVLGLKPGQTGYTLTAEIAAGTPYRTNEPFEVEIDPDTVC